MLQDIPRDVLKVILAESDINTLRNVNRVSHLFHNLVDEIWWKTLVNEKYKPSHITWYQYYTCTQIPRNVINRMRTHYTERYNKYERNNYLYLLIISVIFFLVYYFIYQDNECIQTWHQCSKPFYIRQNIQCMTDFSFCIMNDSWLLVLVYFGLLFLNAFLCMNYRLVLKFYLFGQAILVGLCLFIRNLYQSDCKTFLLKHTFKQLISNFRTLT